MKIFCNEKSMCYLFLKVPVSHAHAIKQLQTRSASTTCEFAFESTFTTRIAPIAININT